jgi:FkbH-like protein
MKLGEALGLIRQQPAAPQRSLVLACGFEPMHLQTFLRAAVGLRCPGHRIEVRTGLYGDLAGTIRAAGTSDLVVAIEWADLDPRLGLRSSGGWGPSVEADILASVDARATELLAALAGTSAPVALAGPTLDAPRFGHTPGWQLSPAQASLNALMARFSAAASALGNVSLLNPARLALASPAAGRHDDKLELAAGFPYSLAHAASLATELARLLYPPPPMKGLITDLDDTLWAGIVGEVGVDAVGWRLDQHAQLHGLYQQQLRQLSESGVLLAVVSKNEPAVAAAALARADLLVPGTSFFPVRAAWTPKSQSVAHVLEAWNVGADSVVFVDDSPMELDEVQRAFPAMTCLAFPAGQPARASEFLATLRDRFGTARLGAEDALRQTSIRANAEFKAGLGTDADYLASLAGRLTFGAGGAPDGARVLELVNKTNQFNLNGLRMGEGEWRRFLGEQDAVVLSVAYADKFGPLGIIGAALGRRAGRELALSAWVLSCRAFARRIEHHMLAHLFHDLDVDSIRLAFRPTERNQPLVAFLGTLGLDVAAAGEPVLTRAAFAATRPELPHAVAAPAAPGEVSAA